MNKANILICKFIQSNFAHSKLQSCQLRWWALGTNTSNEKPFCPSQPAITKHYNTRSHMTARANSAVSVATYILTQNSIIM